MARLQPVASIQLPSGSSQCARRCVLHDAVTVSIGAHHAATQQGRGVAVQGAVCGICDAQCLGRVGVCGPRASWGCVGPCYCSCVALRRMRRHWRYVASKGVLLLLLFFLSVTRNPLWHICKCLA